MPQGNTILQEAIEKHGEEKVINLLRNLEPEYQELNLPAKYQLKQVVRLVFNPQSPLTATVRSVHFFPNVAKYDVDIWVGKGGNDSTRIYNVDETFIEPA